MAKQRDYRAEYAAFHGKPDKIKDRASRNAARAKMTEKLGKDAVKGKDIGHADNNPRNNSGKNLRVESVAKNRGRK